MIVPCVLMSMLSLMVFFLPADSGEKVSLSMTALLSYTVVLLMVTDVAPRDGKVIPLISRSNSEGEYKSSSETY